MDYREEIQKGLREHGDNYTLKTNEELTDIIANFGCGETLFHTADITRLINEHKMLMDTLQYATNNLMRGGTNMDDEYKKQQAIKIGQKLIQLYSH